MSIGLELLGLGFGPEIKGLGLGPRRLVYIPVITDVKKVIVCVIE